MPWAALETVLNHMEKENALDLKAGCFSFWQI